MKKALLATLLILAMIFALASCGSPKPELDLNAAEKNLKGEDYEVDLEDEGLDVGIEEALEAYSEDGDDFIEIIRFKDASYAKLFYKDLKHSYESEIKSKELEIKNIEYILKHYKNDLKSDEIDDYEDDLKELQKELEEMTEDYGYGISGSTVWVGTVKAIEDSKN